MNDEYRTRLIETVRSMRAQQQAEEMTDDELSDVICTSLGLPAGTTFTDEQLLMIAEHRG
jgi:hypothetical protein